MAQKQEVGLVDAQSLIQVQDGLSDTQDREVQSVGGPGGSQTVTLPLVLCTAVPLYFRDREMLDRSSVFSVFSHWMAMKSPQHLKKGCRKKSKPVSLQHSPLASLCCLCTILSHIWKAVCLPSPPA